MAIHQLKRIQKGNVIAQAAQEIRRLVIGNGMPEGAKLPSEHALCARLGVSRSSVREALRVLEAVGLVEKAQGKGVFVRRNRVAYVPQRYRPEAIQEAGPIALQMRMALEPRCAELARDRFYFTLVETTTDAIEEDPHSVRGLEQQNCRR